MDWPALIEDIRLEMGLLNQLLDESAELIRTIKQGRSRPTDALAAGCALQSFYNTIEGIFIMIAERVDDGWAMGDNPRRSLLTAMTRPTEARKAVIDENLGGQLGRYQEFREAFRYGHFFQINWEEIAPLVMDMPNTLTALGLQMDTCISEAAGQAASLVKRPGKMPRYWTQPIEVKQPTMPARTFAVTVAVSAVIGLIAGVVLAGLRYSGKQFEEVPAVVIDARCPFVKKAAFQEPSGNIRSLPSNEDDSSFRVTAGRIDVDSDEPFTGTLSRRPVRPEDLPSLRLSFHQGQPTFFQVVTEQGRLERGCFRDKMLLRYALHRADGLPYRTFHLTSTGQTLCMIERGKFTAAGAGQAPVDGWYYRFYQDGAEIGRLFMSDDGKLLDVGGPVLGRKAEGR